MALVNNSSLLVWGYKMDTIIGRNVPTFLRSCSQYWYRVQKKKQQIQIFCITNWCFSKIFGSLMHSYGFRNCIVVLVYVTKDQHKYRNLTLQWHWFANCNFFPGQRNFFKSWNTVKCIYDCTVRRLVVCEELKAHTVHRGWHWGVKQFVICFVATSASAELSTLCVSLADRSRNSFNN